MSDRIVYGQNDLNKALGQGLKAITLCAGIYDIPITKGIVFDRLGPVRVSVMGTKRAADEAEMVFCDIYPEYRAEYAVAERANMSPVAVTGSGSGIYGMTSAVAGSGIYGMTSAVTGSGIYGMTSAVSGSGIYGMTSAVTGSGIYGVSFNGSCSDKLFIRFGETTVKERIIFGYGIDLI